MLNNQRVVHNYYSILLQVMMDYMKIGINIQKIIFSKIIICYLMSLNQDQVIDFFDIYILIIYIYLITCKNDYCNHRYLFLNSNLLSISKIMNKHKNASHGNNTKSRKLLSTAHSQFSNTQHKPMKRQQKASSENLLHQDKKKIPKIISELEKNVKDLKKHYNQINYKRKSLSRMRSHTKLISQKNNSVTHQIDDIKKTYASIYGKQTNNLLELYNFYKKGIEKSTGILGSMSMSNKAYSMSITNNGSIGQYYPIHEIQKQTPQIKSQLVANSDIFHKQQSQKSFKRIQPKIIESKQIDKQKSSIGAHMSNKNWNIMKKCAGDHINIAHLLSEKRDSLKNSYDKIIFNKDKAKEQQKNISSSKLKEEMERFQRTKENLRIQNFQKNVSLEPQIPKNRYKKYSNVQRQLDFDGISEVFKNKSGQQHNLIVPHIFSKQVVSQQELIHNSNGNKKNSSKKHSDKKKSSNKKNSDKKSSDKKSSQKRKSISRLNEGIIFDFNQFSPLKKQKGFQGSKYYVKPIPKKQKTFNEDSLFGCEITLKDNSSRNLDLDIIPLDI